MATPLYVQDILYYVFPHLDPSNFVGVEASRARQTLVASATTCHDFLQPALNILWRSLPSDLPLASLLCSLNIASPRSSITHPQTGIAYSGFTLATPEDPRLHMNWSRFREYAARVRKVVLVPLESRSQPCLWTEVARFIDGEPILPRLEACILSVHNSLSGPPLMAISEQLRLLSANVREVHLDISDIAGIGVASDVYARLLTAIHGYSPYVEEMVFSCSARWLPYDDRFTFRRLRILRISNPPMDMALLPPLSRVPNLEILSLAIWNMSQREQFDLNCLHTLNVSGNWDMLTAFINDTHLPALRVLSTHVIQHDTTDLMPDTEAALHAIASRLPHLTSLCVSCEPQYRIAPDLGIPQPVSVPGGSFGTLLAPLASLHHLHRVDFAFQRFFLSYSDSNLRDIANAWPELEELRLAFGTTDSTPNDTAHRASFSAVVHLAYHCPRLRSLHLPAVELRAEALTAADEVVLPNGHPALYELELERVVFMSNDDDDAEALSHEMTKFMQRAFPRTTPSSSSSAPPIVILDEGTGGRSRLV